MLTVAEIIVITSEIVGLVFAISAVIAGRAAVTTARSEAKEARAWASLASYDAARAVELCSALEISFKSPEEHRRSAAAFLREQADEMSGRLNDKNPPEDA